MFYGSKDEMAKHATQSEAFIATYTNLASCMKSKQLRLLAESLFHHTEPSMQSKPLDWPDMIPVQFQRPTVSLFMPSYVVIGLSLLAQVAKPLRML